MFRDAYGRRRCILPIDGFYEWKAIKGQKTKKPFAIAMKDGEPFGIGPHLGELERPNVWRVDPHICGDHHGRQRNGRRNS